MLERGEREGRVVSTRLEEHSVRRQNVFCCLRKWGGDELLGLVRKKDITSVLRLEDSSGIEGKRAQAARAETNDLHPCKPNKTGGGNNIRMHERYHPRELAKMCDEGFNATGDSRFGLQVAHQILKPQPTRSRNRLN